MSSQNLAVTELVNSVGKNTHKSMSAFVSNLIVKLEHLSNNQQEQLNYIIDGLGTGSTIAQSAQSKSTIMQVLNINHDDFNLAKLFSKSNIDQQNDLKDYISTQMSADIEVESLIINKAPLPMYPKSVDIVQNTLLTEEDKQKPSYDNINNDLLSIRDSIGSLTQSTDNVEVKDKVVEKDFESVPIENTENIEEIESTLTENIEEVEKSVDIVQNTLLTEEDKQKPSYDNINNDLLSIRDSIGSLTQSTDNVEVKDKVVEKDFESVPIENTENIEEFESTLTENIEEVESTLTENIEEVESTLTENIEEVESTLTKNIEEVESTLIKNIEEVESTFVTEPVNEPIVLSSKSENVPLTTVIAPNITDSDLAITFSVVGTNILVSSDHIIPHLGMAIESLLDCQFRYVFGVFKSTTPNSSEKLDKDTTNDLKQSGIVIDFIRYKAIFKDITISA